MPSANIIRLWLFSTFLFAALPALARFVVAAFEDDMGWDPVLGGPTIPYFVIAISLGGFLARLRSLIAATQPLERGNAVDIVVDVLTFVGLAFFGAFAVGYVEANESFVFKMSSFAGIMLLVAATFAAGSSLRVEYVMLKTA